MSKPSTATAKIPNPLPTKSAWARGPPSSSSRSASPAPSPSTPTGPSHSRRPSNLGPNVPIKDGVGIPRSVSTATGKQGPAVSFGSIDDVNAKAPIPTSPAPTPAQPSKIEVKTFGSVPAGPTQLNGQSPIQTKGPIPPTAAAAVAGTAPASKAKLSRDAIAKMFQGGGGAPSTPSAPSSPAVRPTTLPPSQPTASSSTTTPPTQPPSFTPFVPSNGQRPPPQNAGPNGNSASGSKSPSYRHQAPNAPQRQPSGAPGAAQPVMGSPRLAHQPPPGQMPGQMAQMPPPPQMWTGGYYYVDPSGQQYMYPPWGYMPNGMPAGVPPQGMAMSPRNGPIPMPTPGTPTPAPATPAQHTSPPPQLSHTPSGSISSPPSTPSSLNRPPAFNAAARDFVPRQNKVSVSLKSVDGREISLAALNANKAHASPAPVAHALPSAAAAVPPSPSRRAVRMESVEERSKRLEQERLAKEASDAAAEKQKAEKERLEKEAKEKEEREQKAKADKEKAEKEAAELKERQEKEAAELKLKEAAELKAKEEAEAKAKEEAQKAAELKAKEEAELKAKEEADRKAKEDEEKAKADSDARQAEEEASAKEADAAKAPAAEIEDGEVVETKTELKADKKELPKIDTSSQDFTRRRPGPLDLTSANRPGISPALPSALATAKRLESLDAANYPEGIKSPAIELNAGSTDGKFRYDRDFLLQFMAICKDKPDNLPPLESIGLDPNEQPAYPMSRGGSGRHRPSSSISAPQRQASVGGGAFPGGSFGKASGFSMGNFSTQASKLSSEERFMKASSGGGGGGSGFARPAQMQRTASQGGVGGTPMGNNRTRSKRGEKRNDVNRAPNHGSGFGSAAAQAAAIANLEPVAPLVVSANRWDRKTLANTDDNSPEMVDRKVKSLLNKLTMDKFDSISDQIISWANKSENEKNGQTLIQVIRLVFEKATDEAAFSEMYARLCRKMMEQISSKVQDESIKNQEGKPIAGGQLFRKYLLNRCQEDFERGWVAKENAAAAAAAKKGEDDAAKAENEKKQDADGNTNADEEIALYSDEYYLAQKAKRQGLGLIKFIGELFKLQMLTERIMHECVKKLLGNVENPEEEEIESLCKLLTTVGQMLDTPKAKAHMDVYFSRMKELCKSNNVNSRMQFMLQDILELRERRWIPRNLAVVAPTTIAAVHEQAAKDKDKESQLRTMSMSRGGSRRGGERTESIIGPDGWAVAGGSMRGAPPKAGDLSKFGQINKTAGAPMTFGPQSSIYSGKKDKRESIQRTNSSSQNMFQMLSQQSESAAEPSAPAEAPVRRKLVLAPRSKPIESTTAASGDDEPTATESPVEETPAMSDADAKRKVDEDLKEFFAVRNLEEADDYFQRLPAAHHQLLVDKLVSRAIESKQADAELVGNLFKRVREKNLAEIKAFEDGLAFTVEILPDIAIDAPKAYDLMAIMMKGVGFDEETRTRIASKMQEQEDKDKLLSLLA
ncbi:hypothetical protein CYLTODRAFT_421949 [Cylindrobasidium torrendii FP15055 ss-10]|uniref:MI domain-containing protein n=1 Tax=Cylindrobasidium torrendii FP15055 ss-10 TaxID=1314674 RepID=A0A0D7BD55_9AGAR|nr:hypothetical protein CYLTODRAFT_421949 [Cylindrobasidium torrendii FP15055 ss-10]